MKFKNLALKTHPFLCILFIHLAVGCSQQEANITTLTVANKDFINSVTIEGVVEPVLSTTLVAPRIYDGVIQFLVEDGETVEEGQVVCIIENMEIQSSYDQILIDLENAETGLNKTRADLNMQMALLEAQVKTNEADTKIAHMDSLQIAYASLKERSIKELQLERATIEKERYEKKLEALKVIQQSEVKKLELEIQRLKLRVETVKAQLDALTLKAPRSGMVVRANNRLVSGNPKLKVGDPVWSNFPIATLPEYKEMKAKIMASEADFKMININDSVCFTFDAMPGNKGTGKIRKKAPVGQPYKWGGKMKYFEIEASIDSVLTMPEPGFTANCHIIMKHVANAISVPQIALFEEDSIKVVYVQRKRGFERRQVLTDVASTKETVITAGLTEGEVIALSKPGILKVKAQVALPDSLLQKPETPENIQRPNQPPNVSGNPTPLPQVQIQTQP